MLFFNNKFILLLKKVFNHMNTWIVEKDLMALCFQIKKIFTLMKITYMFKKYFKKLK